MLLVRSSRQHGGAVGALVIGFDRALPRHLTHRRAISEVFVTDIGELGSETFAAGIQLPRRHAFFGSPATRLDSHLVIEVIRQLTIVTCHTFYGVPASSKFLMSGIGCVLANEIEAAFDSRSSLDCIATLRARDVVRRSSGELRSVRIDVEIMRNGLLVATGHGDALIANAEVYRRLRGKHLSSDSSKFDRTPGELLAATSVGHHSESDVVLASTEASDTWQLSVDTANPFYFDHPLDHVPGVLAVEATRQAIRVAEGLPDLELGRVEAELNHVLEFGEPIAVQLSAGTHSIVVELVQVGRVAARVFAEPERDGRQRRPRAGPTQRAFPGGGTVALARRI